MGLNSEMIRQFQSHQDCCAENALILCTGEQEKAVENLEKVHAETLRGSKGVDGNPPPGGGPESEEVVGPLPPTEESVDAQTLVGPILPDAGAEDDPYNLPITHEVTLEGELPTPIIT